MLHSSSPVRTVFPWTQYLVSAGLCSCALRGSADFIGQQISNGNVDMAHTMAMATVGLTFSGVVGATWLALLEQVLGDGKQNIKTAADFTLYAPLANSAYLLAVPFLTAFYQHADLDHASAIAKSVAVWQENFGSAMELEASLFIPYNLLSFRVVPASLRPHAGAFMRCVRPP